MLSGLLSLICVLLCLLSGLLGLLAGLLSLIRVFLCLLSGLLRLICTLLGFIRHLLSSFAKQKTLPYTYPEFVLHHSRVSRRCRLPRLVVAYLLFPVVT